MVELAVDVETSLKRSKAMNDEDEHIGRKRVLSEIPINTVPVKKSSFDTMKPPSSKRLNIKESTYGNNRAKPSSIPVATPSKEGSKSKLLDINTCMGIKQKLKQTYENTQYEFVPPVSQNVAQPFDLHSIETQVITLSEKIEDLKEEIGAISREQYKVRGRISDINYRSLCQNRVLERELEKSSKDKHHMEQMLQLQLQELGLRLDDDYNELKFNLQSEIEQAKLYQNEDILQEINDLKVKLSEFQSLLTHLQGTNQHKINQESKQLKLDLEKYVSKQAIEIDNLSIVFDTKDKELQAMNSRYLELQDKFQESSQENDNMKTVILDIENKMANFPFLKSSLLKSLAVLDEHLSQSKAKDMDWDQKLALAESKYTQAKMKHDKSNIQRRILENSIMNYERKTRVYIKPTHQDPRIKELDSRINVNDKLFNFNKVFRHDASHQYITDEFSCLVKNSVLGSNVSILFVGQKLEQLLVLSITNSYRSILQKCNTLDNWKFNYKFKCLGIKEDFTTVDLLDSLNRVSLDLFTNDLNQIQSQQMIIDSIDEFTKIVQQIDTAVSQACLYVISIEAKNIKTKGFVKNDLIFLDLTGQSINSQISGINSCHTISHHLSKVLNYSFLSNCLMIGNVDNNNNCTKLLECLEQINSVASMTKVY